MSKGDTKSSTLFYQCEVKASLQKDTFSEMICKSQEHESILKEFDELISKINRQFNFPKTWKFAAFLVFLIYLTSMLIGREWS